MKNLLSNSLVVWNEREINLRNAIANDLILVLQQAAKDINPAWKMQRIEAPVLIPDTLISSEYAEDDYFQTNSELSLRPETTSTSYAWLEDYLASLPSNARKKALPLCVAQLGLSFRQEQDKTFKYMRLKQFYQLEFQFIYDADSKADYPEHFRQAALNAIATWIPNVKFEVSDRLPAYSQSTIDIVTTDDNPMELASMSERTDSPIPNTKNFEVAIGIDRLLAKFLKSV